jgi:chromosome segregation protein
MVSFTKLRLAGFKSFVDPTELDIQAGMTGIVGPNGCGKSNLVEALRWVMGETSAKRMRGGEMDDVIFAGSATRPSRNRAEVSLVLDNSMRAVPAQFNDDDEIEVTRRIDRGEGSTYNVNGKGARARDVQLLFADAATGAHSTGLVSQGRIGTIVNAKPLDRRTLLEEAAGITGLHSRRHEAELRLKAAEANLARLDDVIVTLESQLNQLKKQSRQASRYRTINDRIRQTEALLFHLLWDEARARLDQVATHLTEADGHVVSLVSSVAIASTRQSEAAATLAPLREREAEKAAELQRFTLERAQIEREEELLREKIQEAERQRTDIAADQDAQRNVLADAAQAIEKLRGERTVLQAAEEQAVREAEEAQAALDSAQAALEEADEKHAAMTRAMAEAESLHRQQAQRRDELQTRIGRMGERLASLKERQSKLAAELAADRDAQHWMAEVEAREQRARAGEEAVRAAEQARRAAEEQEFSARQNWQEQENQANRLRAEEEALRGLLASDFDENFPPVIDSLAVTPGYEAALAAALGDDLHAALDALAPSYWSGQGIAAHADLPEGAEPLARYVTGSPVLSARLTQIGLCVDDEACRALLPRLVQGQRLVTRAGALYRWDGFTVSATAPKASQLRLERRNRLQEIERQRIEQDDKTHHMLDRFTALRTARQEAVTREQDSREGWQICEAALREARAKSAEAEKRAAARNQDMAVVESAIAEIEHSLAETNASLAEVQDAEKTLPPLDQLREALGSSQTSLAERRSALVEFRSTIEILRRARNDRNNRLRDIESEDASWQERAGRAREHAEKLDQRQLVLAEELSRLEAAPAALKERRLQALALIEEATLARRDAADALAQAESELRDADVTLKDHEARLAQARENRIRAEAAIAQAQEAAQTLTERIRERLDCSPEECVHIAAVDPEQDRPARKTIEEQVERLLRERDNMGPVNLRAEAEAGELETQLSGMQSERSDLVNAIARLRQGISSLNREGRERLLAAFELVNGHFQSLFVSLFGGGKAHLQLTEAEDPLDAGLEIFASPPGKRLQVLSLLSGGEQALTALALLFAVFLVNPAPICVLDEVDAPLDDANVERFCNLVEQLAQKGTTRFLIITHHRLTMARMDRLFGVTMAERGISQLVSVDLQQAEEIRHARVA